MIDSVAPGTYLGWGPFVIQLGNLIVIAVMIVLFVAALVLPFPKARRRK
jgi:large-conductance mechanosensitive channel